jgi:hypothetical protein
MAKQMPASDEQEGRVLTADRRQEILDELEYYPTVSQVRFGDEQVRIVLGPGADKAYRNKLIGFMLTSFDYLLFQTLQHRVMYFAAR